LKKQSSEPKNMNYWKYLFIALLVILLDHSTKLLIHFNFTLGENYPIFDWFRLHFVLNPGMAFGMEFDFKYGKLFLSVFRVFATFGIGYYLIREAKKGVHAGFLTCIALILGGAIGNGIDSIFYGVLLDGNVIPTAPTPWFYGRVIDMLYFPLTEGFFPSWLPFVGGDHYSFFAAIFNVADSAIFVGAVSILIFQKKFFPEHSNKKLNTNTPKDAEGIIEEQSNSWEHEGIEGGEDDRKTHE
jgi:signal peptidase II